MKKATIAFVFAALSIGTMGCNKSKADTANPEEVKPAEPTPPPADGEAPAEGEGDKAAPEGDAPAEAPAP
ncbi:hypothetical protein [Nannocystis sp.]|uniref:hypothetical protein n=1 Tax=Nannocystis sp. TaxID=1962667 RepID=UPI0025D8C8E1|nr:hypothetical protein [Nannocystis sp.]MBK7824941.1 hypothetical protein [Nannocystis sp.]